MLSIKEINLLQALKEENYNKLIAWKEFKAENERSKKENEILLCRLVINDGEDVTVQISESQFDKYNKYRQTLQDIKAIATGCMNKDTCYDCEYCDDCYIEDAEIPTYDICKLLIQKITKAEEENGK